MTSSLTRIATAVEMLLQHQYLTIQDADVVEAALDRYRRKPSLGFSDCLVLEIARKAGHIPLGTFDRDLSRAEGAETAVNHRRRKIASVSGGDGSLHAPALSVRTMASAPCAARLSLLERRSAAEESSMGLFGNLMNKIFHGAANAEAPPDAFKPGQSTESRVEAAVRQGVPVAQATPGAPPATAGAAPAPSAAPAGQQVDVAAVLDRMAASHGEKLDWKRSIVDLMKLVGMDSSLSARKELAADLNYTGDTNDSAKMNVWLHSAVMRKLAENGGKVPSDLLGQ